MGTPHTLARYGPIWPDLPLAAGTGCATLTLTLFQRERGFPRLAGNDGGVNPGPIWPCLASFTPSWEAGNEATLASFGTPLTPTRWAGVALLWPWLASSGVARSGKLLILFRFVPFRSISCRPNPHPCLDSSLRWNDGTGGRDARFPSSRERRESVAPPPGRD